MSSGGIGRRPSRGQTGPWSYYLARGEAGHSPVSLSAPPLLPGINKQIETVVYTGWEKTP